MFSLGGLPFFVGFFGKFFVVFSAVQSDLLILAVLAVLFSVVSAAYYLRIIKVMWFDPPEVNFVQPAMTIYWVTRVAGWSTILLLPALGWLIFRAFGVGLDVF